MNNLIDIIIKYNNLTKEEKELFNKVIKTNSVEDKSSKILKDIDDYVNKHKDTIRAIPNNPYIKRNPWINNPTYHTNIFNDLFYPTSNNGGS